MENLIIQLILAQEYYELGAGISQSVRCLYYGTYD
jgi:hypothetical protein